MIKKNKIFLCAVALACAAVFVRAQEAKTCFVNMPDSLSPLLTPVNRADCVDFLESNMKAEVTNTFGGKSQMTVLTSSYIHMRMTAQSTWQMRLLALDDSAKVICTVSTVSAPAADSQVRFYDTRWQPLPATDFLPALPVLGDFTGVASDTADGYHYQDAGRLADMLLMRADLSPADDKLTFTFTTPDYLDKETADKLAPFIRRSKVYVWEQGRYVPQP